MKLAVEPLWLRVKGVSPAPRAATSERERVEVQRFDVLAVLIVLYELHEAQLVVFIHEVDDLVQQLFAVAASDGIVGVGGRGPDKDIDKRGGFWYSTKVPCANDTRWCGAMAAQLICNQWVAGSTPVTSSKKSYDIPLKSGVCRGAFAFWEKVRRTVQ